MRWCVALFLCLLSCSAALSFAPARADELPTVGELRARADAASGVVPDNVRETITSTGSLGATTQTTYRIGNDVRETFERGGLHGESGEYHGESWHKTENGLTIVDEPDPGRERGETTTSSVRRVTKPFDAFVVETLNVRKNGTRTYYDPATFRELRRDTIEPAGTTRTTNDEFAQFGSRTLPSRWTVTSSVDNAEQHYVRSAYVEGDVVPAEVAEHGTTRTLVEFPPGVSTSTLPAKFIRNAVMVRVTIGSRSVDFLLDSGSDSIFVDADLARELGLTLFNTQTVVVAQRITASQAIVPEIRIGDVVMHTVAVRVGPMPQAHPLGAEPRGLLGFDFLAQLGVTIDYLHGTVTIVPADHFVPPTDSRTTAFNINVGKQVPMVSVGLGDAVADHMMLDTGWSGQLGFFDYFARRYPEAFRNDLGAARGFGVGGPVNMELYEFRSVALGRIHFYDFQGTRLPPESFNFGAVDGVIGADMLALFTLRFDYTNGRVFLTPNYDGHGNRIKR